MTFETPPDAELIKAVGVEGSHDGATWLTLATDKPIFRMAGDAANLDVSFPKEFGNFSGSRSTTIARLQFHSRVCS